MSRTEGMCRYTSFSLMSFVYSKTHVVTSFVIMRDSCHYILPQWSRGWRGAFGVRSLVETSPGLSISKHAPISTGRLHSWMCVRARVLTPLFG